MIKVNHLNAETARLWEIFKEAEKGLNNSTIKYFDNHPRSHLVITFVEGGDDEGATSAKVDEYDFFRPAMLPDWLPKGVKVQVFVKIKHKDSAPIATLHTLNHEICLHVRPCQPFFDYLQDGPPASVVATSTVSATSTSSTSATPTVTETDERKDAEGSDTPKRKTHREMIISYSLLNKPLNYFSQHMLLARKQSIPLTALHRLLKDRLGGAEREALDAQYAADVAEHNKRLKEFSFA